VLWQLGSRPCQPAVGDVRRRARLGGAPCRPADRMALFRFGGEVPNRLEGAAASAPRRSRRTALQRPDRQAAGRNEAPASTRACREALTGTAVIRRRTRPCLIGRAPSGAERRTADVARLILKQPWPGACQFRRSADRRPRKQRRRPFHALCRAYSIVARLRCGVRVAGPALGRTRHRFGPVRGSRQDTPSRASPVTPGLSLTREPSGVGFLLPAFSPPRKPLRN
jgi:hypothetical protein